MELEEKDIDRISSETPGNFLIVQIFPSSEKILKYTKSVFELIGITKIFKDNEPIQTNLSSFIFENDRLLYQRELSELAGGKEISEATLRLFTRSSQIVWVRVSAKMIGSLNGCPVVLLSISNISQNMSMYESLLSASGSLFMIIDRETRELLYSSYKDENNPIKESLKCFSYFSHLSSPCPFCIINAVDEGKTSEKNIYSAFNKRWYRLIAKPDMMFGRKVFLEFLTDISNLIEAQKIADQRTRELEKIINNVPSGVCVFKKKDGVVSRIAVNKAICQMKGLSEEDIIHETNDQITRRTFPADREKVQKNTYELFSYPTSSVVYRTFNEKKKEYIWLHRDGNSVTEEDGTQYAYVSYTDISDQKKLEAELNEKQKEQSALINSMPGGVFKYNRITNQFSFVSGNMLSMLGYSYNEFTAKFHNSFEEMIWKEDRERVLKEINEQTKSKTFDNVQFRVEKKNGKLTWLLDAGHLVKDEKGNEWFYVIVISIDDIKKLEEEKSLTEIQLKETQNRYQMATKGADINVWEYDLKNNKILTSFEAINMPGTKVLSNIPSSIMPILLPKDRKKLLKFDSDIKSGKLTTASAEFWIKLPSSMAPSCQRLTYSITIGKDGKPIRAYGIAQDVTLQKKSEENYLHELDYLKENKQPNLVAKGHYNLSQNKTIDYEERNEKAIVMQKGISYDEAMLSISSSIDSEKEKQNLLESFGRENLIKKFNEGNRQTVIEYKRTKAGTTPIWASTVCTTFKDPFSDSIECFMYTYDDTEKIIQKQIINRLAKSDYELLSIIDAKSGYYHVYDGVSSVLHLMPKEDRTDYRKAINKFIEEYLPEEEKGQAKNELDLDNIAVQLKSKLSLVLSFDTRTKGNRTRRKAFRFTYLDENRDVILLSRIDITEQYEHDLEQIEKTKKALKETEEANKAKSVFLSNISHDMRTPLNGIIGFTKLAEISKDPVQTSAYLNKIDFSGKFLLDLINDTLDLSRIESGKTTIELSENNPQDIIDSVTIPILTTAEDKSIDFVVDTDKMYKGRVMLDSLKFEKILLNLLSNAVKFTPSGGTIRLKVEDQMNENSLKGLAKITISDTGIGISKDFLPRIFEPFSQEKDPNYETQVGTGLGLSIVDKIVKLMNGTIRVESEKGKGTSFFVTLPFDKCEEKNVSPVKAVSDSDAILKGKHILLCEDNPLNTELAKTILQMKGMEVTSSENGKVGVEYFSKSPLNFFDAILMDIRMPVMDGLEATKQIRNLKREDAKKIPIIALTADAFDTDMKKTLKVGMSAHLSKPINTKELLSTLSSLIASYKK
jgi:PAS domain S-box-containing protein